MGIVGIVEERDGLATIVNINFGHKQASSGLRIVPRMIRVRKLEKCLKRENMVTEHGNSFSVIQGNRKIKI